MIIKFDHITYVVSKSQLPEVEKFLVENFYSKKFEEIDKANIGVKMKYLKHEQELHNLYYYVHDSKISIEVITYCKYTECCSPFSYDIQNNKLFCSVESLNTFAVLKGFEEDYVKDEVDIKGVLDKSIVILNRNDVKESVCWNLDNLGFCCPTFLVTKAQDFKNTLERKGLFCTEIEKILIGQNIINVFFVEGYNGEVFEIISLK
jgi:hypothetical protein